MGAWEEGGAFSQTAESWEMDIEGWKPSTLTPWSSHPEAQLEACPWVLWDPSRVSRFPTLWLMLVSEALAIYRKSLTHSMFVTHQPVWHRLLWWFSMWPMMTSHLEFYRGLNIEWPQLPSWSVGTNSTPVCLTQPGVHIPWDWLLTGCCLHSHFWWCA